MAELSKDFKFKKQFGQNFILDKNFMNALVRDFNLPSNCSVLEIGAGAGVLTEDLANSFEKVVIYESNRFNT